MRIIKKWEALYVFGYGSKKKKLRLFNFGTLSFIKHHLALYADKKEENIQPVLEVQGEKNEQE